jgi:hypothetical protein
MPLLRSFVLLCCSLAGAGCYTYVPMDTSLRVPDRGESVALDISDRGRVGLSERFGEGVMRIEGRVRSGTPETFEMQIWKVSYLRDGDARWSGETATVNRDFVSRVQGRQFSKPKTIAAVGIAIGSIAALIVTRELISSGNEGEEDPDPDPDPQSIRFPLLKLFFR